MSWPNDAQRAGWFAQNFERETPADYEPTDTELGGLAAAWHTSRADVTANPDRKDEWA